tara:strand:- start:15312 stop:17291 length:1980 start_codon:yes stop_codon:yes gene_type:complete
MALARNPKLRLQASGRRITTRLRMVLGLIAVTICIAGFASALQLRTILDTHKQLNSQALPMFALAQRTARDLNALFLALDTLNAGGTEDDLDTAMADIANHRTSIQQDLDNLRDFGLSEPIIDAFQHQLSAAKTTGNEFLQSHLEKSRIDRAVASALIGISAVQTDSHVFLDTLASEIARDTNSLVRNYAAVSSSGRDTPDHGLSALLLSALNLNHIRLDLDAAINSALAIGTVYRPETIERSKLVVSDRLRGIIGRLSQIDDRAVQHPLAQHVSALRQLILGEQGIFALVAARNRHENQFVNIRATRLPLIAEISNLSSNLMQQTLTGVETASHKLDNAIYRLLTVIATVLAFSLLIIALTDRYVVERQFNRRIKTLTGAVTAIADGKLDHPIPITGRDELGEMAQSLVVFRRNAEELRRSNIELEKFAYVAAHDLRSPLRAIRELSAWVVEDEDNVISVESRAFMTMLQDRIDRLNRLLNDLLDYARVGQNDPQVEPVDLHNLVCENALLADPDGRFTITYDGPDAPVVDYPTQLQQIVGNLLGNAIKHHDLPHGTIRVVAAVSEGHLHLDVQDDGPGIPPQYQTRIFELFQTLSPRDEVEGSGLGLAIVQKLVQHRRGSLSLASDPSVRRGTTFSLKIALAAAQTASGNLSAQAAA